jgi:transcription initiation factor TFIID TATA-box-binding protein
MVTSFQLESLCDISSNSDDNASMRKSRTAPQTLAEDGSIRPLVINNCVSTCNVGRPICLPRVMTRIRATKYNSKIFAALELKLHDPHSTTLIFGSGRFVVSGCRTVESARLSMAYFIEILEDIGINVEVQRNQYSIQNIVSTTWVGRVLSLAKLYAIFQKESSYEPQLFPGLTFRPKNTNMVLLLFTSGKVVLTGAKVSRDLKEGYRILMRILKTYDENNDIDANEWERKFHLKSSN